MMRVLLIAALLLCTVPLCHADPRLPRLCFTTTSYSGSMWPAIEGGERVLIIPWPIAWVRIGEVVVYYSGVHHINVIHRVEAIVRDHNGRRLIVKGDANPMEDYTWVTNRSLVGLVVWIGHAPKRGANG